MTFWETARSTYGHLFDENLSFVDEAVASDLPTIEPASSLENPYVVARPSKEGDILLTFYFGVEHKPLRLRFRVVYGHSRVELLSPCCGDALHLKEKRFACARCGNASRLALSEIWVGLAREDALAPLLLEWLEFSLPMLEATLVSYGVESWLEQFGALVKEEGVLSGTYGDRGPASLCKRVSGPLDSMSADTGLSPSTHDKIDGFEEGNFSS